MGSHVDVPGAGVHAPSLADLPDPGVAVTQPEDSATRPSSPSIGTAGSLEAALVPSACGLQPRGHCRAKDKWGWPEAASRVQEDQ